MQIKLSSMNIYLFTVGAVIVTFVPITLDSIISSVILSSHFFFTFCSSSFSFLHFFLLFFSLLRCKNWLRLGYRRSKIPDIGKKQKEVVVSEWDKRNNKTIRLFVRHLIVHANLSSFNYSNCISITIIEIESKSNENDWIQYAMNAVEIVADSWKMKKNVWIIIFFKKSLFSC